ncbi:LacI family transcriptional regulator [Pedobacter sp. UYP30]|uniref:LacI family DNA-binding transcriptional regulator n=1 Tax=Pedobacter sp. UYP30 TaxID=1756400 RepID=UPI0033951931
MKTLSIKDIAALANVSITTVSFIINGKAKEKSISDGVIKKVEKIIAENGYKPNQTARSLRTGNSYTIGLLVEDISNSFFAKVARKIEDKAYSKGYKIIYSSTENNAEKAKDLIHLFKSRNLDAYIISPINGIEKEIEMLLNDNKPVIFFDRNLPAIQTNYVGVDHFKACYDAVEAFIKDGKRKIALITTDVKVDQIMERHNGYEAAISDGGLSYDENLVLKIPFKQTELQTISSIENLLLSREIDAVLFSTNYLTLSGLRAIKNIKRTVNSDFTVIGYDDHVAFELHSPEISTVQQPIEEIAESIINLILKELSSKVKPKKENIIFPATLILRSPN